MIRRDQRCSRTVWNVNAMLALGGVTAPASKTLVALRVAAEAAGLARLSTSEDHVGRSSGSLTLHAWDNVLVDP